MARTPPLPDALWRTASPELQAAILLFVQRFEQQIAEPRQQVQDLNACLDQNSTNSSKPPSSDPIGVKRERPVLPSKKRRGGQEGHPRRMRALVPPVRVSSVTECKPTSCRRCGRALSGEDAEPLRHQVAELPSVEPEVHDYRLHRLPCPHCDTVTCGALPDGVPRTAFGPRLHAALGVLTGAYRLSKRQVAQLCSDMLGLTISVGMIAKLERITAAVLTSRGAIEPASIASRPPRSCPRPLRSVPAPDRVVGGDAVTRGEQGARPRRVARRHSPHASAGPTP